MCANKLILVIFLLICIISLCYCNENSFQVNIKWQYINYTWASKDDYRDAIISAKYVPENVAMTGIKIWKDKMYIAMPKIRHGVPVTLGWISLTDAPQTNPLISPFPDWPGVTTNCNELQSVQSMEIDRNGIMWVIDGFRINNRTQCPPKLVLFDLKSEELKIVHSFTFPNGICLHQGGFLNDIVVDESNGTYAYITDNSAIDPGLIVYSLKDNRSWKLRDSTMFAEVGSNFVVDGHNFTNAPPIDGIALSPQTSQNKRTIYYCSLGGKKLYGIETHLVNDEKLIADGKWREKVQLIGKKQAESDGLAMDNKGNLYYGLLPLYGVGKWQSNMSFSEAKIISQGRQNIIWPDSFAFDNNGSIYLLANNIDKYFDTTYNIKISNNAKFNILKLYIGAKSYLYP